MEGLLILLGLGLVLVLVVFPVWTLIKIASLRSENDAIASRLLELETELRALRSHLRSAGPDAPASAVPAAEPAPPVRVEPPPPVVPPALATEPTVPPPELVTPPLPATSAALPAAAEPETTGPEPEPAPAGTEPPLIAASATTAELPPLASGSRLSRLDWEQFMGAKLSAWLGGLAALLGVGFFLKYSFEHELIPPAVRVSIGFLFAIGLVIGGLRIDRARYAITAQTLIATGIVSLYTVTFACRSIYHFEFFGPVPTFLLMVLITSAAFLLAVRLEAQVVAILGMLGGFLTPILVSTGQDNPLGLFGYIALLDVGLMAVALHRRWLYLVPLGAIGTIFMQVGWAAKFFARNPSDQAAVAAVVGVGFAVLFLALYFAARRSRGTTVEVSGSAAALPVFAFGVALYFLNYPEASARITLFFSFALAAALVLLVLAWFERQPGLVVVAAAGVCAVLGGWAARMFTPAVAPKLMLVSLGFTALFLAVYFVARRTGRAGAVVTRAVIALPLLALAFAFCFLASPEIGDRPGLLFGYVLVADLALLAIAWFEEEMPRLQLLAGSLVFLLLAAWTGAYLTAPLLPWALVFCLVYAALHTAFPLVLNRRRPDEAPGWWSQLFPPMALALLLIPLFKLETLSLLFWPCVLLVDLLAIGLALLSASLAAVGTVLVLTLVAAAVWLFHVPATVAVTPSLLLVVGGFAVLFFVAGSVLARRFGGQLRDRGGLGPLGAVFGDARAQIPAMSALLPFVLLILMTARLPLASPTPVFGLALLLVVLVLGLTAILGIEWLPACALAGVAGLEYAWHSGHATPAQPVVVLAWFLVFHAVFTGFPFVFRDRFARLTGPWAVAALAGVAQFPLVHRLVARAWPSDVPGLVPALFAVPPLIGLFVIARRPGVDGRARLNQLAWFGGVALLFITLVFPIQLERQWLTVAWALEGAALLWLFHRVPHAGLRLVGVVLLGIAFARLALNPAVLSYHARSTTPILNWYFYSYGVVTLGLFVGAWLLAPPRERVARINVPPLLNTLGTVLAFMLVNIEIADFFSVPGQRVLTFQFSGNFGRDMTYTIAWALFALALLLAGIWRETRAARYAALALLSAALLKLFFHDLARLDALYRVGALLGVAVIATLASFAYQRFLPAHEQPVPPPQP